MTSGKHYVDANVILPVALGDDLHFQKQRRHAGPHDARKMGTTWIQDWSAGVSPNAIYFLSDLRQ